MLPRLSGNSPLPLASPPSSNASAAAVEPHAAPAALPSGSDGAIHDEAPVQAAGHADNDPEAAVAHRFWLPNDTWSSIAGFLPRTDILSLRSANSEIRRQVDDAIQSMRLRPENLAQFINSDSFKNVRNLDASLLDQATLGQLITHLGAHPRPEMTIRLEPSERNLDAATMRRLSTLSLKGLVLELYATADPKPLNALAACRFSIDLHLLYMSHEVLVAASNLPTLRRLVSPGNLITSEEIASRFAAHRALEALNIGSQNALSPRALQLLASIPTLRELHIDGLYDNDLDLPTACAIAANPNLQDLSLQSSGRGGLSEAGFAALSQSQSLTTLYVPFRAAMLELANMKSVRNLVLVTRNTWPQPALDAATARSIAALPALESIAFSIPDMARDPGALTTMLKDSVASKMEFWNSNANGQDFFDADERTALMANTRLKAWEFSVDDLRRPDGDALLNHPTIDFVKFGIREFTRPPESKVTLTLRPG